MNKFNKNILYLFAIIRLFDLTSTYFSNNGNLAMEMNPIVKIFNFGWFGLIMMNLIFILIVYFLLKIQSDDYYNQAEKKYNHLKLSFSNYLSYIYFDRLISFLELFVTSRIRYKLFFNALIHTLLITIIICSFIIGINNFLIGFNTVNLFSYQNKFYQNSLTVFLTFFAFIFVNIYYHYSRYKKINPN
jgi:hypothetical protein